MTFLDDITRLQDDLTCSAGGGLFYANIFFSIYSEFLKEITIHQDYIYTIKYLACIND